MYRVWRPTEWPTWFVCLWQTQEVISVDHILWRIYCIAGDNVERNCVPWNVLKRLGRTISDGMKFTTALEDVEKYIPRATLMNLAMFWSLDGGSVSLMLSSACNLSLWFFSSNSTLKNPTQYKIIPNAEMVAVIEGKRSFGAVISTRVWISGRFGTWARYLILRM